MCLNLIAIVFLLTVFLSNSSAADAWNSCIVCNSTSNLDCIYKPKTIESQICDKLANNTCFTLLLDDQLHRGCFNESDELIQKYCMTVGNNTECFICENGGNELTACNDEVILNHHREVRRGGGGGGGGRGGGGRGGYGGGRGGSHGLHRGGGGSGVNGNDDGDGVDGDSVGGDSIENDGVEKFFRIVLVFLSITVLCVLCVCCCKMCEEKNTDDDAAGKEEVILESTQPVSMQPTMSSSQQNHEHDHFDHLLNRGDHA